MIATKQTVFGYPYGNCFAACVASLLEIDISECPVITDVERWQEVWESWFTARGIARLVFNYTEDWKPRGWCIISGISPRVMFDELGDRVHHSCVGYDGGLYFDPHPDETFLEGKPTYLDILYPLDPTRLK